MTAPRRGAGGRQSGDEGSATVLVLALCSLLVVCAAVLVAVASVAVVRHRAAQAADSAALAAATRSLHGVDAACRTADELARASGARLLSCALQGDLADVLVEVRPEGWLSRFGAARGRARAGPG